MTPRSLSLATLLATLMMMPACSTQVVSDAPLRVATFNVSLNADRSGELIEQLRAGSAPARMAAAVIQRQRPDLLLLNEFDHDADGIAVSLFLRDYLGVGQHGEQPIDYPYHFSAEVNTGVASGLDLDLDGRSDGANDAWGYGTHPGQYGMLVLSRYPIERDAVRSFRLLRWATLPEARRPRQPGSDGWFYPDAVWQQLRLSSKSHWDIPLQTPFGRLHFLVSHPTPPVFDGPERRNALRNHDEIRLWAEYLSDSGGEWLVDDAGRRGGLPADARFVLAGDQNADPLDGASEPGAIQQLLDHPRVLRYPAPRSAGAVAASARLGGVNLGQRSDPAEDTSEFSPRAGNMRVDYVLPSQGFDVVASGVFWPLPGEPGSDWLEGSDHRMVWLDLRPAAPPSDD
jgi:endonuclease/exonuclease/phosphatase family metal-dependent hydrolase